MSKKSVENEEKLDIEITDGPVENATDEIVVEQEVIEEEKPEEAESSEPKKEEKKEKAEKVDKKSTEFNKAKAPKDSKKSLKKQGKSKKKSSTYYCNRHCTSCCSWYGRVFHFLPQ